MPITKRTMAIAAYLRAHPSEPYRSVALRYGVSFQYVQQVAARDGQPPRPRTGRPPLYHLRTCTGCGAQRRAESHDQPPTYKCQSCRRVAVLTATCGRCGVEYDIPAGPRAYSFRINRRRYPQSVPECPQCWRHYSLRGSSGGRKKKVGEEASQS